MMVQKAKETAGATSRPAEGQPPEAVKGTRSHLVDSAEGSRQRGVQLRRLLATGDWLAMVASLCFATAATSSADVATLFWAVLFSPVWVLVVKLHGLYDHDHRRIRHSTLDELPTLVSASALGMLALNGLLALSPAGAMAASSAIPVAASAFVASLALRAGLRLAWHHLIGMANGVAIGSSTAAEIIARRVAIHPEARLQLVGYLGPEANGSGSGALPRLGGV